VGVRGVGVRAGRAFGTVDGDVTVFVCMCVCVCVVGCGVWRCMAVTRAVVWRRQRDGDCDGEWHSLLPPLAHRGVHIPCGCCRDPIRR
jgi:hypothetical protein